MSRFFIFILLATFWLGACSSVQKAPEEPMGSAYHWQLPKAASGNGQASAEESAITYYSLGQAYSLDNEVDKAIEAYQEALVYDPHSAVIHTRLAAELIKQGSLTEAKEHCETAVQLANDYVDAYLLLAGIQVVAKEYRAALKTYETVLKKHPDHQETLLYYGTTLAEAKHFQEAKKVLNHLAKLPEDDDAGVDRAVTYYYLAKVEEETKEIKQAIGDLHRALDLRPGFSKAALLMAELLEGENNHKQAMLVLEDAFTEKTDAQVAAQLARDYLEQNKYEKAVPYLETMIDADPDNENLKVKLALVYWQMHWLDKAFVVLDDLHQRFPTSNEITYYLAELELERSGNRVALPYFLQIQPEYAKYEQTVSRVAWIQREEKQYEAGITYLEKAMKSRPDIASFYSLLAMLYEDRFMPKIAASVLEEGVKRFSDDEKLLYYLGFLYDSIGQKEKGFQVMEEILKKNPMNASALNYIGYSLLEKNSDLKKAEEYLVRAYQIRSDDPYILDSYGWLLFKEGKTREALQTLEKAYKAKPEEAIIAEHLGDVYVSMHFANNALKVYSKAYDEFGKDEEKERIEQKIKNVKMAIASKDFRQKERDPASSAIMNEP